MKKILFILNLFLFGCNKTDKRFVIDYYKSGALLSVEQKENGISNGQEVVFFPNGSVSTVGYLKNGKLNGNTIAFSDSLPNEINHFAHYVDDVREGVSYSFYPSGYVESMRNYKKGKRIDKLVIFYDSSYLPYRVYKIDKTGLAYYFYEFNKLGQSIDSGYFEEKKLGE